MGELHLEIIVDRLMREFKVEANVGKPQVAYRETLRRKASINHRFVKQTGGKGQFAHVVFDLEPSEVGKGFEFVSKITRRIDSAGVHPGGGEGHPGHAGQRRARRLPDRGRQGHLDRRLVPRRRLLGDGLPDRASVAFKEAARKADPAMLEPIWMSKWWCPAEYMGDVIGDLNSRRGRIAGTVMRSDAHVVAASVPLAKMFGYSTRLRSTTQGRAIYSMQFARYKRSPKKIAEEIIARVTGKVKVA